jgi:hypothetical protein
MSASATEPARANGGSPAAAGSKESGSGPTHSDIEVVSARFVTNWSAIAPDSVRPVPNPAVTEERLRFTQGVVAILVMAGFVFEFPWMNPVVATSVAVAIALGPQADVFAWPFDQWLVDRIRTPNAESIPRTRLVMLTTVVLVGSATVLWGVGFDGVGDLFGLVGAGVAALYATTGIVTATAFRPRVRLTRRRPRRRP